MTDDATFHVAFLTNFSDTCFRAIPAVAQLCDELAVRLTVVHAFDPVLTTQHGVEVTLRSFFPEADRYGECRRVALPGTPVDAVRQLAAAGPVDLIVAPAGDPLGLPRLTRSSIRARLVREAVAPVWTVGPGASAAMLGRPHRHVACVIRVGAPAWHHVRRACDYAKALGAALHVVHVLPHVHDGVMARLAYAEPFDAASVTARIRRMSGRNDLPLHLHVTNASQLPSVLDGLLADIVFVDGTHWITRRWLARRVHGTVDALRRPVVCVAAADEAPWPLAPRRHERTRRWSPVMVPAKAPVPALVAVSRGARVPQIFDR